MIKMLRGRSQKRKRSNRKGRKIDEEAIVEVPKPAAMEDLNNNDEEKSITGPSHPHLANKAPVIFILENALLQKGLVRKRWKILSTDEDTDFLLRQKKNLNDYRPEIVYEALREILDSPLNQAGMVEAVYVVIHNGLSFEVKPHCRIPRTCKRFRGLMLELLEKRCIRSKETNEILIRVIENPVTKHLPVNCRVIGVSNTSKKVVDIDDYVSTASDDVNLVFVVDTMVNGKINNEDLDDFISVSNYSLVANWCIGLINDALEERWKICGNKCCSSSLHDLKE